MPACHYCNGDSVLVNGDAVYPHRPDLAAKKFWRCEPCDAHVGCHGTTHFPLGNLANAELRRARMQAHQVFDDLWKSKLVSRTKAYRLLSHELGIDYDQTHIGHFNLALCKKTIQAANQLAKHLKGN